MFMVSFFIFVVIAKGWFKLYFFVPFFIGGIIGTILPNFDHLLYAYILRPNEHISQRIRYLIKGKDFKKLGELVATSKDEREKLIFHSLFFQLIFIILTFLVVTSSGSVFGTGLVLAFSLHLLVDQLNDLLEVGNLKKWVVDMPFSEYVNVFFKNFNKQTAVFYWVGTLLVFIIISFFL